MTTGIREKEAKVQQEFRDATAVVPEDKQHWIAMSGSPDETVAMHAVMYDMTVVGQHSINTNAAIDLHPERIARKSGRPVLMIPKELDEDAINRRAVLVFDARAASTRVLHDAMQILETKNHVDIVSFGDEVVRPDNSISVVEFLRRHGISADRIRLPRRPRHIGEDIIAYCKKVNAGTLFMDIYGRGSMRDEILFGGATRYVLEHSKIPVLVSRQG